MGNVVKNNFFIHGFWGRGSFTQKFARRFAVELHVDLHIVLHELETINFLLDFFDLVAEGKIEF